MINQRPGTQIRITIALPAILSVILQTVCPERVLAEYGPERESSPGVVNPAIRSNLQTFISLDGNWDFAVDPQKNGEAQRWYLPGKELPNKRLYAASENILLTTVLTQTAKN